MKTELFGFVKKIIPSMYHNRSALVTHNLQVALIFYQVILKKGTKTYRFIVITLDTVHVVKT